MKNREGERMINAMSRIMAWFPSGGAMLFLATMGVLILCLGKYGYMKITVNGSPFNTMI
jgi:hypothetical protein